MNGALHEYDVLDLPIEETEPSVVLAAFERISLLVHPDKAPATYADKATTAFQRLGAAKGKLCDRDEQKGLLQSLIGSAGLEPFPL